MSKQETALPENTQQTAQKVTTLITEETIERRHSIRSMQAMGNIFKTEDEDEIFDNVYLGIICVLWIQIYIICTEKLKLSFYDINKSLFFYSS